MAHVTLVSSEPIGAGPGGGITTFVRHFGRLLLARGDRVTWIIADPTGTLIERAPPTDLQREGAEVVFARVGERVRALGGDLPFQRSSAAVADAIPAGSDVVYVQDWGAQGFVPVRRRRLLGSIGCPIVTVLHSTSEWIWWGMQAYPGRFVQDTCRTYAERYAVAQSDFVVAPGDAMRRWLIGRGWQLPEGGTEVLGFPFYPPSQADAPLEPAGGFRRLVFFGRLQTVKGLEVFVGAVRRLAAAGRLAAVEDVVLLGGESQNRIGRSGEIVRVLRSSGVRARALTDLDSASAQAFLAEHRADSLVVVPSLVENFPYAVIEATLVPGLNVICSRVGGVPEILGERGRRQLFDPHEEPLAEKMVEFLERGPLPEAELARYDDVAANERWLGFHERVLAQQRSARALVGRRSPAKRDPVDVCVVHHDQGAYLEQLLWSLEAQTDQGFAVTVVDDGSNSPAALSAWERLERAYAGRGWRFVRQERADLGAARNTAARLGDAEFMLFINADDIAAPRLVEVFRAAAERSRADCLGCYALEFAGEGYPLDRDTGALLLEPLRRIEPPGGALSTALVVNPFGLPVALIRREAFEAVGGYRIDRWLGEEDYEMYVRLACAGFDVDVVPEVLAYHRRVALTPTVDRFRRHDRILRVFREQLAQLGMAELPDAVCGLHPPLVDGDTKTSAPPPSVKTKSGIGRLSSPAGWEYAHHLAEATTWRVLAGALALKARGVATSRPRSTRLSKKVSS
jgi:glycosyltransferase involved in cell wall biosynthesis/GT2 family glycosyltransferase